MRRLADGLDLRGTDRDTFHGGGRAPARRQRGRPGTARRPGPARRALPRAGPGEVIPREPPGGVPALAGRAGEMAVLTRLLDQAGQAGPGTVVISAIGGTAGVGKTALAVHWAHQVAGRFPDGQLYVNLRGFDPSGVPATPAEAIRGFLDALGVPPERIPPHPDAQAGLYRSLLADTRMLIVLDNARDEAQVRPLLPASPASLVLVTSRSQLAGLAAAHGARLLTLDVLPRDEAVQLLTVRLGRDRIAAEPDAVEPDRRPVRVPAAGAGGRRGPRRRPAPFPARRAGRRTARLPPAAWTRWTAATRRRACGPCSPGPTGSSARRRRGCSGCLACTPAPTSASRPPPAWPAVDEPRPAACCASWPATA